MITLMDDICSLSDLASVDDLRFFIPICTNADKQKGVSGITTDATMTYHVTDKTQEEYIND